MAITAFSTSLIPFGVAAGFLVCGWVMRLPRLALAGLGLALVCGQLIRLPLPGQGGGLLVSDVAVAGVLVAAWWQHLRQRRILPIGFSTIMLSIILFSSWSLFPLLLPGLGLTTSELLISLLYWLRLSTYLLLLPALLMLVNTPAQRNFLAQIIWVTILGVLLTIVLQLWIVPDLRGLPGGWDPHLDRAVGSWLDPNFLGAFLGLSLLFSFPQALQRRRPWMLLAIAGIVIAILLTRSRSTLVMLGGIVVLIVPILALLPPRYWSRYLPGVLGVGTLVIGLFVAAVILLKERAISVFLFDPTVELRLQALKQVWQLVADHGLVGVGYNAYQFAALRAGLIGDYTIHSRAGADNTFLTLWITTGIIGVALYSLLLCTIGWQLWHRWRKLRDPSALAALLGGAGLVIHSQFVNSLLYGHLLIMLTLIVVWGLTGGLAAKQKTTTKGTVL